MGSCGARGKQDLDGPDAVTGHCVAVISRTVIEHGDEAGADIGDSPASPAAGSQRSEIAVEDHIVNRRESLLVEIV